MVNYFTSPSRLFSVLYEYSYLTLEMLPLLLFGAAVGAWLQVIVSPKWLRKFFGGKGFFPLIAATGAGALLPGCGCMTVPLGKGLKDKEEIRISTVAVLLLVSPLLSPQTILITWGMLGWKYLLARIIATISGGLLLGTTLESIGTESNSDLSENVSPNNNCRQNQQINCPATKESDGTGYKFWIKLKDIFSLVLPYFLIGMGLAAAIALFLPPESIPTMLGGESSGLAYLLSALVGIPLYVCEGQEVPFTYTLINHGLGAGPSFTFLLGSIGTCIPTLSMLPRVIGLRSTVIYTIFWLCFTLTAGFLFGLFI